MFLSDLSDLLFRKMLLKLRDSGPLHSSAARIGKYGDALLERLVFSPVPG